MGLARGALSALRLFALALLVAGTHTPTPGPTPYGPPPPTSLVANGVSFLLTEFSNQSYVNTLLVADSGVLTTSGSLSCKDPDHVAFNALLDGSMAAVRGMTLTMNNQGLTCQHNALVGTGHVSSIRAYGYGDYSIKARTAHSPTGGPAPANAFTCFGTFIGVNGGTTQHNEVSMLYLAL